MPVNGTYGVYAGGVVSKHPSADKLVVGAAIMRDKGGDNLAIGDREISVRFGQAGFAATVYRPSDLDPPIFGLDLPATAGSAYVVFEPDDTREVTVVPQAANTHIVLAKVSWGANSDAMADLSLATDERTQSRVIDTPDPLAPGDLYDAGMDFGDAAFNGPLVSMSVLSEVLQAELRLRGGAQYNVVLINAGDINGLGQQVAVAPFKVFLRLVSGGREHYRVLQTLAEATFSYDVTQLVDERIYVWVNQDTGAVGSGTAYSTELGVLAAYADVTDGMAGCQDLLWILANEIAQANIQTGAEVELHRKARRSGFARPLAVSGAEAANQLDIAANLAILNGVMFPVPTQHVVLPEAPLAGVRTDLLFLEAWRVILAAPPTDGSFYVPLTGVGYVATRVRVTVAAGVAYDRAEKLMANPAVVAIGGGAYALAEGGYYKSAYGASSDGESWAVPVALVSRFNRDPYLVSNLAGGGLNNGNPTRPDDKRHDRFHQDEIEVVAPVLHFGSLNYSMLLGQVVDSVLRANHPNQMGASSLVAGHYSKRPLQVEAIAPEAVDGANWLGAADGIRRRWTPGADPYWVGTHFAVSGDYTDALVTYEDGSKTLIINAPVDGHLYLGGPGSDQPVTALTWLGSGGPVGVLGPWSVGESPDSASILFDIEDPDYDPAGTVCVSYRVRQSAGSFLAHVPVTVYGAIRGATDVQLVDGAVPETRVVVADGTELRTPVGATTKGDAVAIEKVFVANGTNAISIPLSLAGRAVLGPISAEILGDVVGIQTFKLGEQNHSLEFADVIVAGRQVKVVLALGGQVANYRPRNRSLDDLAIASWQELEIAGGATGYGLALPANSVLLGALGFVHQSGGNKVGGVYVDDRLYPCTYGGFDRNRVQIDLTISSAEYLALPAPEQTKWETLGGQVYQLRAGAYGLKLPLLRASSLGAQETLLLTYDYAGMPSLPVTADDSFKLAARGYLLASNSSIANTPEAYVDPVTEKFPSMAGELVGVDEDPETTFRDILTLPQSGPIPLEGMDLALDGTITLGAGVVVPNGGFMAWMSLVELDGALYGLSVVSNEGAFTADDPAKAFLTYPHARMQV